MKVKRLLAGAVVACGMLVASPAVASANIMWCVGDPPVQMKSPSGTNFTVTTQIFTSGDRLRLSQLVEEVVVSTPDGHGGTLVTVEILGPADQAMMVVASVYKYKVANVAAGVGVVRVTLDVPVA